MILENKKKDFIEVLSINKEINLFIKYLRRTLKIEQKHSIILVENLQKNLLLVKNSQSNGILDLYENDLSYGSDESRVKKLVEYYLHKK